MSGAFATQFSFGFSTKYHDRELGMVSYQRRFYRPDLGRWLNRDPIEEKGGENLYSFCKNNSIVKTDMLGLASSLTWEPKRSLEGWNFGVSRVPYSKDFDVIASYTLTQEERKCCSGVRVDRYVKKFLGIGGRYGDYVLDHADEGGGSYLDEPYTGYAEGDKPDGQTLFIYRMPWTQAFKFIAICSDGPNKGKQLSSIEKLFKTDGHFFGQPYEGRFVDE